MYKIIQRFFLDYFKQYNRSISLQELLGLTEILTRQIGLVFNFVHCIWKEGTVRPTQSVADTFHSILHCLLFTEQPGHQEPTKWCMSCNNCTHVKLSSQTLEISTHYSHARDELNKSKWKMFILSGIHCLWCNIDCADVLAQLLLERRSQWDFTCLCES